MTSIESGAIVVVKEHRVGMVRAIKNDLNVLVQFGADGPFEWWAQHSLRHADRTERQYLTGSR